MKIVRQDEARLYDDFLPLIAELECGRHYEAGNPQHVAWLRHRVASIHMAGGTAICMYDDDDVPVGFLLLVHDRGLEGVRCFGKVATIAMFGLSAEYRGRGLGPRLLHEAEKQTAENGGECIYVNTYAGNPGAMRFYVKHGFVPVAYHPGENGLDDKGQVYLYKELA